MTRHGSPATIGGLAMAAALMAACDESPTRFASPPQYAVGQFGVLVYPDLAELTDGQTQTFTAFACPLDADGNPIVGPDGVPGTQDDECQPITTTVEWSVIGNIGTVSPPLGSSTTLTAALPDGSTEETGVVRATAGTNLFADADVHVSLMPDPVFTVHPDIVKLSDGESVELAGWNCPRNADGHPDPGPDGVPGTSDDLCEPAGDAQWSVSGNIGSISTMTGPSTTLTAALPDGSFEEHGEVVARFNEQLAAADVLVTGSDGGEPIGLKQPCVQFSKDGRNRSVKLVGEKRARETHCRDVSTLLISFDAGQGLMATFTGGQLESPITISKTDHAHADKAQGILISFEGERITMVQWLIGTTGKPPIKTTIDGKEVAIPEVERVDLKFPATSNGHITAAEWRKPGEKTGVFVLTNSKDQPYLNDAHVFLDRK